MVSLRGGDENAMDVGLARCDITGSAQALPSSGFQHQSYTLRLPTPPRVLVPPPAMSNDMPVLQVGSATPGLGGDELDTSFLKQFDLKDIVRKNAAMVWTYESRREAQMILPWLWLGPLSIARDRDFLKRQGFTMMLAIRANANTMNGAIQAGRDVCLEVGTIEAAQPRELISQFRRATWMINQHLAKVRQHTAASGNTQMGRVLLFCESGNDKSAAVAAAYLMEMMEGFDHIHAMQVCQSQRFCVNFDDNLKNILATHYDILRATRTVASARAEAQQGAVGQNGESLQVQQPKLKTKRSRLESIGDGDTDMGDVAETDDVLRFEGRTNTPFW